MKADLETEFQNRRNSAEESIALSLKNVAGKLEQVATTLNQRAEEVKESSSM